MEMGVQSIPERRGESVVTRPGVHRVFPLPPWGGNKIKGFGDGEENLKLEKRKKNFED